MLCQFARRVLRRPLTPFSGTQALFWMSYPLRDWYFGWMVLTAGSGAGKEQTSNQYKAFGRWGRRWWMELSGVFLKPFPFPTSNAAHPARQTADVFQRLRPYAVCLAGCTKKKWSETKEAAWHGPKTGQSRG